MDSDDFRWDDVDWDDLTNTEIIFFKEDPNASDDDEPADWLIVIDPPEKSKDQ
jgi:hypothetical protein